MLELSRDQFKMMSEFFSDVAKGVFLAALVNPAIPYSVSWVGKLFNSFFGVIAAAFLLFCALYLNKLKEKIW